MFDNDLMQHRLEFARALDNSQYETSERGLYFPRQKVFVSGGFTTWVNGQDMQFDPNLVPAEGLAQILKSGLGATAWYVAPFVNNTTVQSTLTAATFTATMGEFTAYDESTRQAWTVPTDPVAGVYSNSASLAVITASSSVGTGAGVDIYGAAVIGASAKSATTGKLVCCSLFSGSRNLKAADKLTVQYDVNATSV
jgi:hypothetical protein